MLDAIGTGLGNIITWVGEVVTSLTSSSGALYPLLPLFTIGIAVTFVLLGVKIIRSFTFGA